MVVPKNAGRRKIHYGKSHLKPTNALPIRLGVKDGNNWVYEDDRVDV